MSVKPLDEQPFRVVNQNLVMALRAMIGVDCDHDQAVDIIEVIRPHFEQPWVARVKQLQDRIVELENKNMDYSI